MPVSIATIEDCFLLSDGRLLILPDFPVIEGFDTPKTIKARIEKSDYSVLDCQVTLALAHLNIPNSTDVRKRWRIIPELHGIQKSDLEIGDRLCIDDKSLAAQLNRNTR